MYFSEIYIDNFKTLRKVRINLNKELNVFTGTNNAGKTTILEALALWNECFRTLVIISKRTDKRNSIHQGDYRLGNKSGTYIDHRTITSVRTSKYEDIFYEMNSSKHIVISVKLVGDDFSLDIPIKIKAANGGNYLINLDRHDNFNFEVFNSVLNLPTPFSAIYASPVAALVSDEKYFTTPQIGQQILSRKSFLVLRNRISKLKKLENYENFENDISYILSNSLQNVSFEVMGDINKDVKVNVNVRFAKQKAAKDISLLGSGTLQIIELMLAIYEDRSDLNLIMLDEPDSHIHRDIQKRLISVLVKNSLKAQVFLTTHNESLIRATDPKNIFHISNSGDGFNEIEIKPITYDAPDSLRIGIQPSSKSKVIKSLGNSDSLDILDCLEANKIIFVEGESDALYIKMIYEKIRGKPLDNCVFWSLNGLDGLIESISQYKKFLKIIASDHDLWGKAVAVFDADYITIDQKNELKNKLKKTLDLDVFIWDEYTIEASIVKNDANYIEVIHNALIGNGVEIEKIFLKETVDKVISDFCCNKLIDLNESVDFQNKISGQILNRKNNWKKYVGIDKVFLGGDHNLLTTYQSFARPLLQDKKIFHIVTKSDLSEITTNIFNLFEVSLDYGMISNFEFLLRFYHQGINVKSWNNLANFIEKE